MQKKSVLKIFAPLPPSAPTNFSAPLFDIIIMVQPMLKHVNSIFTGKFAIFFKALTRVKNFKGPFFALWPPLQVFVNDPLSQNFFDP